MKKAYTAPKAEAIDFYMEGAVAIANITGILPCCFKSGKVSGNDNDIYGIDEAYSRYCQKILVSRQEAIVCSQQLLFFQLDVLNVTAEFFDVAII